MSWWLFNRNDSQRQEEMESLRKDKQLLIQEIRVAHRNWINAQAQFEYALGKDQVDYAIFTLEATEKRYEMLVKQAKQLQVSLVDVNSERLLGV
jgi:hypothetical protein